MYWLCVDPTVFWCGRNRWSDAQIGTQRNSRVTYICCEWQRVHLAWTESDTRKYAATTFVVIQKLWIIWLKMLQVFLMQNTSMVSFDGGSASKVDDVTACHIQDGGYALLWQRYDNNKMAAIVTMETLWKQDGGYALLFYIFNSTVIDWTCYIFLIGNLWIDPNFSNGVAFRIPAKILSDRPNSLRRHTQLKCHYSIQQCDVPITWHLVKPST